MTDYILARIDQARMLLAEAKDATDAKKVKDLAQAAKDYAARQRMGHEAINYAHAIVIESMRLMGMFLKRTKKAKGGQPYQKSTDVPVTSVEMTPTLAENGITGHESADAQLLDDVAEETPSMYEAVRDNKVSFKALKNDLNRQKRRDRVVAETKANLTEKAVVIAGDCLSVLESVPPIDLLITDPPYFTEGDYTPHVSACLAKVKVSGQAYVFAGSDPLEIAAYLAMDTHDMRLEQILIWNYNNTGQRQPNQRYTSNYQVCFYYRGPQAPAINKPSDGTHQYACQTVNAPDGRIGDRWHEWQKPIELIERLIRNSSAPGDFVFDPFAGSGTTILAAAKLGRVSLGCDIDQDAIAICTERGCICE